MKLTELNLLAAMFGFVIFLFVIVPLVSGV